MMGAQLLSLDTPGVRASYERLWAASPQRTAFAHPAAAGAWAAAFGLTLRLAAVPEGDGFAAALPVFERRRGPFVAAALPPLMPFVSPLLAAPPAAQEVHARRSPLDALLGLLAARYHQAALLLHPSLGDLRPLLWGGWTVTPRYTYEVDLTEGDGLAGWSAGARRLARQAAGDYRIEEDDAQTEAAVTLMEEGYRRHSEELGVDGSAVRRLARALCARRLARTFAAVSRDAGTVEAAVVVAYDGQTAHYWIAGSRPGPAMTALLAHILPRFRADGVARFDFVGANTPSIAEFKRRFGPCLRPYAHARVVSSRALRILDRVWRP